MEALHSYYTRCRPATYADCLAALQPDKYAYDNIWCKPLHSKPVGTQTQHIRFSRMPCTQITVHARSGTASSLTATPGPTLAPGLFLHLQVALFPVHDKLMTVPLTVPASADPRRIMSTLVAQHPKALPRTTTPERPTNTKQHLVKKEGGRPVAADRVCTAYMVKSLRRWP